MESLEVSLWAKSVIKIHLLIFLFPCFQWGQDAPKCARLEYGKQLVDGFVIVTVFMCIGNVRIRLCIMSAGITKIPIPIKGICKCKIHYGKYH